MYTPIFFHTRTMVNFSVIAYEAWQALGGRERLCNLEPDCQSLGFQCTFVSSGLANTNPIELYLFLEQIP